MRSTGAASTVPGSSPSSGERVGQRAVEVGDGAALLRPRQQRAVDRLAQLRRQVAPLALQRRQRRAEPPGGRDGAAGADRVDAGEAPRTARARRRRGRPGRRPLSPPPARAPCRRACRSTSPVRVSASRVGALDDPRDAEVGQLRDRAAGVRRIRHEHVRRLHVAVDDPLRVGVRERLAERDPDLGDVAVRQLAGAQQLRHRPAAHELGHEVGAAVLGAGLVERHDRRVRQARGRARLLLGAPGGVVERDRLDRDLAREPLVARQPDDAEGAGAELPQQPIAVEHELLGAASRQARGRCVGAAHAPVFHVLQALPPACRTPHEGTTPRSPAAEPVILILPGLLRSMIFVVLRRG